MHREERIERALHFLRKNDAVTINQLAEVMACSIVTVRQDMDVLESRGKVERFHGGVRLRDDNKWGPDSLYKLIEGVQIINFRMKEKLSLEAESLVKHGDTLFIGGGTTPYIFSQLISVEKEIQVVTTCLNVAIELEKKGIPVFFAGGEITQIDGLYYSGGPKISYELQGIAVDKAFIGVSGIHDDVGLTIYDLSQFNLYHEVRAMSQKVILLCDRTKFGVRSAHQLCALSDLVDIVVTNKGISAIYQQYCREEGVALQMASEESDETKA